MKKKYVFKTFRTLNRYYVYDRSTNSIIAISKEEYDALHEEERRIDTSGNSVIMKYQKCGAFLPNIVETIEHPAEKLMTHYLKHRVSHVILQVTQQCNLRCEYCSYSGIYDNMREHCNKHMDIVTAKKAIDFAINRCGELSRFRISFYGGEPLLQFGLIKECVSYAKGKISGRKLEFGITTNGTLLKEDTIPFLIDNDFNISISLDGPKEVHDANRRFSDGRGSFNVIMANVQSIKKMYPEYAKNMAFLTVLNPKIDLECVLKYFNTDEIFEDCYIMYNSMSEQGLKEELHYKKKFQLVSNYEYLKMLFSLIGRLNQKYVSKLMTQTYTNYQRLYNSLTKRSILAKTVHPGGPCLVGTNRLFVDINGNLYPCERVDENATCFQIGNIYTGFDMEKICHLLNNAKCTEQECINCWNLINCKICTGDIDLGQNKTFTKEKKLLKCKTQKEKMLNDLYELCTLHELGYQIEQEGIEQ